MTYPPPRVALRIRWRVLGAHVHCRVLSAPTAAHTFALAGTLTFSADEWLAIVALLGRVAELLPEDE